MLMGIAVAACGSDQTAPPREYPDAGQDVAQRIGPHASAHANQTRTTVNPGGNEHYPGLFTTKCQTFTLTTTGTPI